MAIKCPYCAFAIELKGIRAGRFQPKCPRCGEKFGLVIHADANMQPTVTAMQDRLGADVAAALGLKDSKPSHTAVSARPISPAPVKASEPAVHATHVSATIGATSVPGAPPIPAAPSIPPAPSVPPAPPAPAYSQPPAQSNVGVTSVPGIAPAQAPVDQIETPPVAPDAGSDVDISPGTALGGYEVIQKLGSGGMGAVYLARQVSLDRNVALKTLHQRLAADPQLVSRFTREAYAAAQLTHHNIVQIHDIGQDKQTSFFSMEFVSGVTLANALREAGKLDTETAVSYVLQAARGLKFAHDHGLIHRDIKPENLLLNDQGIVKVADLGLVKRMGSNETEDMRLATAQEAGVAVTQVNKSMGTPLYMPPEQAVDAARVDHRADIYSLGCTLYHLVTGRPPFTGRTAMEVMTKHQHEPVTPPDVVVKDVPAALSPIVGRMLAKRPEDRYAGMKDVIAALEGFLGVASAGPYTPKDDQVKILEFAVEQYNKNFWARLRPKLILAFYAACALLALLLAYTAQDLVWKVNFAGGMIGLALLTTLAYQITVGVTRGTYLFRKIRQLVFGAGVVDWLLWLVGVGIFGFVVYSFGLWGPWLFAAILAVMLAQAFYWTFDHLAARDRETHLRHAEHLIKQMRLKGLDENAIRQFVCRFSGKNWEEFFEDLFGYEAKMQARQIWGKERGKDRPKFGAWREPVLGFIEYRIESRKQIREAKLLARLETKALQAKGIGEKLARKQAGKNAQRLVSSAEVLKRESERAVAATLAPSGAKATAAPGVKETAPSLSSSTLAMSFITSGGGTAEEGGKDQDRAPEYVRQSYLRRRYGTPMQILTSSMARFALSLILLTIFANWWNIKYVSTIVATGREITSTSREEVTQQVKEGLTGIITKVKQENAGDIQENHQKVGLPFIGDRFTKNIEPYSLMIAGALLLIGCLFRGRMLGLAMYLSAGIALIGYLFTLPVVGTVNWLVAAMVALGVWMFAVIFLRVKND